MEKTDTKIVDVFKKCSIFQEDNKESDKEIENSCTQGLYNKRRLNVPICDVHTDNDYDKNLKCTFDLPISYVKHFKKIGDEIDVSLDYIVDINDKQWVAQRIRSEPGKDVSKLFSYDAFETVINILERYTAFSKDPIPLINAEKLIREQLSWNSQQLINIINDVYKYWLKKREQLGKSLCRRYWPQAASSDSNPHQVFRTRDKERYRLRKQQKRNDVDAFRKMQQLRREFNKAKALSELIQERELLCQADFDIQREIFEQRLHELKANDEAASPRSFTAKGPRKETPFRHTLKFEYINPDEIDDYLDVEVTKPYNKLVNLASSESEESEGEGQPHKMQRLNGSVAGSVTSNKKNGTTGDSSSVARHKGGNTSTSVEQALNAELKKATTALSSASAIAAIEETRKKLNSEPKRKKKDRLVLYTVANGVTVEIGTGQPSAPSGSSGVLATIAEPTGVTGGTTGVPLAGSTVVGEGVESVEGVGLESRLIHPNLDGPVTLCQPLWPTFMSDLTTRDPLATSSQRNLTNYIRDLEYKRDANDQVILPDKYRSRCRVGRGGRLVMDRIPIYPVTPVEEHDYWSIEEPAVVPSENNKPAGNIKYFYPTSLKYKQQLDLTSSVTNSSIVPINGVKPTEGPRLSLGSATGSVAPGSSNKAVVSPAEGTTDTQLSESPNSVVKPSTRPLSEIPFSNRKLRSYNVKIKANNQLLSAAAGPGGAANVVLQKLLPTDLPSLMPPAHLVLNAQTKQKLMEICVDSDSEDEKVLIPKALRGYPELEYRSAITKSSLAAAAAAGGTAVVGSASLENYNPCSKSNVKYNVYL